MSSFSSFQRSNNVSPSQCTGNDNTLILLRNDQSGRAQTFALSTLTSPSGCLGGEICTVQPSVLVTYESSGEIAYSFVGSIFVQIGSSPTGYEKLHYGNPCNLISCGQEVTGSLVSVPIVGGKATFQVSALICFIAAKQYTYFVLI
jgi:hypothetical protein